MSAKRKAKQGRLMTATCIANSTALPVCLVIPYHQAGHVIGLSGVLLALSLIPNPRRRSDTKA